MNQVTVLFDGYCVLCNWFGCWLRKNFKGPVKLAAMQTDRGQEILRRHGYSDDIADEVVVIENGNVLTGAPAILFLLRRTNVAGRFFYGILRLLPSGWIKWGYRVVANNRYKWFGKRGSCSIIPD